MTPPESATFVIETQNLTKRYGDLVAVNQLNLQVREGEILGLLGPNGAGKTTTINLICGLLQPDQGRVLIHGQPIRLDSCHPCRGSFEQSAHPGRGLAAGDIRAGFAYRFIAAIFPGWCMGLSTPAS